MFPAALIVFRETLEAAMFVGIVAAATQQLAGRARWLIAGVAAGALGAVVLALMAERISALYDGIGQDLMNVGILSAALTMLVWHCVWVSTHGQQMAAHARDLGRSINHGQRAPWTLFVAVALAVLREGAETVLFVGGSIAGSGNGGTTSVLTSCTLGLAAGAIVGALMYVGLSRIPTKRLFAVTNILVALLAASIASQLARTLGQAGLVERWSTPLWDSTAVLAPDSALGTVLHALVGYDAQPSGAQLTAYLAVLTFIYLGIRLATTASPASTPGRSSHA